MTSNSHKNTDLRQSKIIYLCSNCLKILSTPVTYSLKYADSNLNTKLIDNKDTRAKNCVSERVRVSMHVMCLCVCKVADFNMRSPKNTDVLN